MLFGSLKSGGPPIAVDFGASRLKVMQIAPAEEGKPVRLIAAACRATPLELLDQPGQRLSFQVNALTEILKAGAFRGKRAVCSVSALHTFVQHIQVTKAEGRTLESGVHDELRALTGRDPSQFILRFNEICEVTRGGAKKTEVICLAMPRDAVLAHMKALRACRLDPVGIHAEHVALVKGLERMAGASATSDAFLIIDLGASATKLAVAHGGVIALAKVLPIGSIQLRAITPKQDPTETSTKRALREQLKALASEDTAVALLDEPANEGPPPLIPAAMDALADEVAQCARYYHALFPEKKISRAIFVGGEALQTDLCKRIARAVGVPAQVGDPLNALPKDPSARFDGVDPSAPAPGWAVAYGLCTLPTET